MKKKIISAFFSMSLMVSCVQTALAADQVQIDPIEVGAKSITTRFTNGNVADWYHLYVGDVFLGGELTSDDIRRGWHTFDIPDHVTLKNGEVVKVEMLSRGSTFLKAERVVGQKESGKMQETKIKVQHPRTVRPGETVKLTVVFQDATGQEKDITDAVAFAKNGPILENSSAKGSFIIKSDAKKGDVVNVVLTYKDMHQTVKMTVVSDMNEKKTGIRLGKSSGVIGTINQVDLCIRDVPKNAKSVRVSVDRMISGDKEAVILASLTNLDTILKEGKGNIRLKSDQVGTATGHIQFLDSSEQVLAAFDFNYDFTNGVKTKQVKMRIGVKSMSIDGVEMPTDVAPFIQGSRTFVPLRALAEAFGADVRYDAATQQILIKSTDQTVVMTINNPNIFVNGTPKEIDIAPYLTRSGRTIIPVRFAAEGLGYKTKAILDEKGLTDSVLFTK